MEESKFKIGDVVMLVSGGPKMTIVLKENDGVQYTYKCVYFSNDQLVHNSECIFPENCLIKM